MGKVRKFQCSNCKRIVENNFEESTVICGHCESTCIMPEDFGPGVVIDDFLILKLLGKGGMGNVYLAHEFSLDRQVALKILKDSFMSNEQHKIEFIQEARSVASLNDPNIIQAHKVGEENGIVFFVTEYVQGKNLKEILEESGPMEVKDLLPITIDVVSALDYAWETRKLVHRDIKPENIMLNQKNAAKLMDLGLSLREGYSADDGDQIKGTPQYISPDQIVGTELDNRTDFYCLGATLYHLVTGRQPFEGNLQTIIQSHLEKDPVPLTKVVPGINEKFAKIIHKLMAKMPNDRYQSSEALLSSLKKLKKAIEDEEHGKKHFKLNAKSENKLHSPPTEHIQVKKKNTMKLAILAMMGVLAILFSTLVIIKKTNNQKVAKKEEPKVNPQKTSQTSNKLHLAGDIKSDSDRTAKESKDLEASGAGGKIAENTVKKTSVSKNKKTSKSVISANDEGKIVLTGSADSMITTSPKHIKNNYGKEEVLRLNNSSKNRTNTCYIRFDLSNAPKNAKRVKLRLYVHSVGRNVKLIGIKLVEDNSWDELSISSVDAPQPGKELGTGKPEYGKFIHFDITSEVKKKMADNKQISFFVYIMEKLGSDTYMNIHSKENGKKSNHPALIFE